MSLVQPSDSKMSGKSLVQPSDSKMSGKQFNAKYKNKVFYRLTNEKECHHGFKFKTGLNVDTIQIDPTGWTNVGGLYFTDEENFSMWLEYNSTGRMMYYRIVSIPDDAEIYEEVHEFKTNKFVLGERFVIEK